MWILIPDPILPVALMKWMQFSFQNDPKINGLVDKDKDFQGAVAMLHWGIQISLPSSEARWKPEINSSLQVHANSNHLAPAVDISDNVYDDDIHIHIYSIYSTNSRYIGTYIYILYVYKMIYA